MSGLETIDKLIQTTYLQDEIDELSLDKIHFNSFSPEICKKIESLANLKFLSLNNCKLEKLDNFPILPKLIRLELMENYFQASELINLEKLTNLQSLAIGGNKIDTFNDIQPLFKLQNLFQLDLSDCKICKQKFYRNTVFSKFPNLKILDNKDKEGFSINYEDISSYESENEDEEVDYDEEEGEESDYIEEVEENEEETEQLKKFNENEEAEELSKPKKKIKK